MFFTILSLMFSSRNLFYRARSANFHYRSAHAKRYKTQNRIDRNSIAYLLEAHECRNVIKTALPTR